MRELAAIAHQCDPRGRRAGSSPLGDSSRRVPGLACRETLAARTRTKERRSSNLRTSLFRITRTGSLACLHPSRRQQLHVVGSELAVCRQNRKSFDLRLGDQNPIERITVMMREPRNFKSVLVLDRKGRHP